METARTRAAQRVAQRNKARADHGCLRNTVAGDWLVYYRTRDNTPIHRIQVERVSPARVFTTDSRSFYRDGANVGGLGSVRPMTDADAAILNAARKQREEEERAENAERVRCAADPYCMAASVLGSGTDADNEARLRQSITPEQAKAIAEWTNPNRSEP